MSRAAACGLIVFVVCGGMPSASAAPVPSVCRPSEMLDAQPTEPMTFTPCVGGFAGPYPCSNVDLEAVVPLAAMGCESGNSLWGWTDPLDGKEYALMGCDNGISFVDISTPDAPIYLGRLPTHEDALAPEHEDSLWRDVRVYSNHAFIVSEQGGHHIQVFDLTQLRGVATPPVTFTETALYEGVETVHTVAINEATGFVYAAGSNTCAGGLHMINAQDPVNPIFAGCVSEDGYTHETQCVVYNGPDADYAGHELCFSSNTDTLTIVDVTNKSTPVQISRTGYAGSGYTHQGWLTEDQAHFLLNDELDEINDGHNSYTYVWNLADLDAPVLLGHYTGPTTAIDHNLYIRGSYAFESNYRAGLRILDVTGVATATLTEVAYFDIYPADDAPEFNANWNNYPFFASGTVILSGIEQGLFILHPNLNPFPTSLLVTDVDVTEGDSGSILASFTVSLSVAVPQTVTVDYTTLPGTATPGADYAPISSVLTFNPGVISQPLPVTVFGDTLDEADETFQIQLSNATNASIADAFALGRILDNDPTPSLAISDVNVAEGDGPGATASFTVSLSAASGRAVSALFATANGTATGNDYLARAGSVSLPAGTTSQILDVTVTGDERDELDEFFTMNLSSPSNATLADNQAIATILDDDTLLVTSVSPTSGPADGGVAITITGENFESGAGVTVGGLAATGVSVVGTTQIQATTPALPPGTLDDVVVLVPNLPTVQLSDGFFADFLDVDGSHLFHDFIESIFRAGVTVGCGSGGYCPDASVTRGEMAVFLLKSLLGADYVPPAATGIFTDVLPGYFAIDWVENLYVRGITGGCNLAPLQYCPDRPVTRGEMAVFLLKTLLGSAYVPPSPAGIFGDVPIGAFADRWIEDLYNRAITGGCDVGPPPLYCPDAPNTRGQMAVFLTKTFSLP